MRSRHLLLAVVAAFLALPASTGARSKITDDIPAEFAYTKAAKYRRFKALVEAAGKGDVRAVQSFIRRGGDVNGRDVGDGVAPMNRPIVVAAARGHLEVVDALLSAGAMPDWCCCSCVTALHEAIRGQHVVVVKRLLEAGADPRILCDGLSSTLDLARKTGNQDLVATLKRSLADSPGASLWTSDDRRSLQVLRRDDPDPHQLDILARCGSPAVGEPRIRDVRRAGPVVHVTYGKHCFADVNLTDLSLRCAGCD